MWIPPEDKEPLLFHHPTRKSVGYFGAVRLRDGKLVFRREDKVFSGETYFAFIKHLRRVAAPANRKVLVIADNARYHHACLHKDWREQAAARFAFEHLPPYSPELNPIERVWKLTRRQATHNCYFSSINDVVTAVERVFRQWHRGNTTLRRLCAIT